MFRSQKLRRAAKESIKKCMVGTLALCVAITGTLPVIVQAQDVASDFEPPVIEHEAIEFGELGEDQTFSAVVVDNEELSEVTFFYRFEGETAFINKPMELLPSLSLYSVTIETTDRTEKSIEYYIQAEDTASNVVLKGFAFEPLVRVLQDPNAEPEAIAGVTDSTAPADTPAVPAPKKRSRLLYVGLGVLALLAVGAAAAGGGGGDSGPGPGPEPEGCSPCTVSVSISPF